MMMVTEKQMDDDATLVDNRSDGLRHANHLRSRAGSDMAGLAGRVWLMSDPNPGILFARKRGTDIKRDMRNQVAKTFGRREWPYRLRVLTLPGVRWSFERQLLGDRESGNRQTSHKPPKHTLITALEREEEIYRAALGFIPGREHSPIYTESTPTWASTHLRSRFIQGGFYRASFERMAMEYEGPRWNAAWLDFNGPLSQMRTRAICHFWERHLDWRMVVTVLNARFDASVRDGIETYGDIETFLLSMLGPTAELLSSDHYADPSPMVQMTFGKGA